MRLLYLEDERDFGRLVKTTLERIGFVVDVLETVAMASSAIRDAAYDLLILDRCLPDGDGLDVMRDARSRGSSVPVILATAQDRVAAKIEALNAGADDYVTKPFTLPELVARVHAILRRPAVLVSRSYKVGNTEFDALTWTARVGGSQAHLSRQEGILLELLMRRAGQAVTRGSIENALFGYDDDGSQNAIEAGVSRLRKALAAAGTDLRVHTVRGVGYLLAH